MKVNQVLLFISLCVIVLLSSCSKPGTESMCVDHFLSEFDMKAYNGEELECLTYIRLYQYGDIYFAYKNNHCADFAPFIIYDCNGNEFCLTSEGPCYVQESIDHGIIGIEKK